MDDALTVLLANGHKTAINISSLCKLLLPSPDAFHATFDTFPITSHLRLFVTSLTWTRKLVFWCAYFQFTAQIDCKIMPFKILCSWCKSRPKTVIVLLKKKLLSSFQSCNSPTTNRSMAITRLIHICATQCDVKIDWTNFFRKLVYSFVDIDTHFKQCSSR